jgi:hypothetical protein
MDNKFTYYLDLNNKFSNELMNKNIKLIYPKATRIFNTENLLTKRWNMIITPTYYIRINGKKYLLGNFTSGVSKIINHYSNPNIIAEKANLSKIVKEDEYLSSIHPKTYILKVNKTSEKEIDDFIKSFGEKNMLIVKPANLYGGQGIQIFNNLDDVYDYVSKDKESSYIMQQYINNPLLLDKKKFDIRVHVLLDKDYNLYINKYAVIKKTKRDYNNNFTGDWEIDKFIHITNNSIQKADTESEEDTSVLTTQMLKLFEDKELTSQVIKIVKTLLLQVKGRLKPWTFSDSKNLGYSQDSGIVDAKNSTSKINCYELFGFDILLDENYKAWLIEVNLNPGFFWNNTSFNKFREKMISDMFNIILLSKYSRNKSSWKKIQI